jgi:hypothetical protein
MECLEKQSLLVHGANDRTGEAQNGSASTLIAFQCECGDVYCWETLWLSRTDYAAFRAAQRHTACRAEARLCAPKRVYATRFANRFVEPQLGGRLQDERDHIVRRAASGVCGSVGPQNVPLAA